MQKFDYYRIAFTFIITIISLPIAAEGQPQSNADSARLLANCFADSLNGRERKLMAKWVFFAMSTHSEMAPYTNIDQAQRAENRKAFAALVNRLLTEDCLAEARAALNEHGTQAIGFAFSVAGRLAMRELMTEHSVKEEMGKFAEHLDTDAIKQKLNHSQQ